MQGKERREGGRKKEGRGGGIEIPYRDRESGAAKRRHLGEGGGGGGTCEMETVPGEGGKNADGVAF